MKSMKTIVYRVLIEANLTFEDLMTLLTRAEACLNLRSIIVLSSDPSDLMYLTPGHFLIGDSFIAVAEPDMTDILTNRLTRTMA